MNEYPMWVLEREDFPPLLQEIPDLPNRLFVRGALPRKGFVPLCVVGSRALTPYGARMCASLVAGLARQPVAIISGLALGADAAAHKAALDVGLPTVAVLPSSVDDRSIYPSSNFPLAQNILKAGGALVSEYEGPFKPGQYSFGARNRIMAGMSKATLIIEAAIKSGTLITARLALDYNREVLALPHDIGRTQGEGANRLIREGATLVRNPEDICQTLGLAELPKTNTLPLDLTDPERTIVEILEEPMGKDELIEMSGLPAHEIGITLSKLLIRGLIAERLGKIERV